MSRTIRTWGWILFYQARERKSKFRYVIASQFLDARRMWLITSFYLRTRIILTLILITIRNKPPVYADHAFVKSLTIKSSNIERLAQICREINEFKKSITKREIELKEKADLVEQATLIETKGKQVTLPNVLVRPQVDKRANGSVELHTNGLRYVHSSKEVPNIGKCEVHYCSFPASHNTDLTS